MVHQSRERWSGVFVVLAIVSALVFAYGFVQPNYSDPSGFQECYSAISYDSETPARANELFESCRARFATSKKLFEDYAASFFLLSLVGLAVVQFSRPRLKAPRSRLALSLLGLCVVVVFFIAYVGSVFWEQMHELYPHWADSLGIPIAEGLALTAMGLVVVLIHLAFLIGRHVPVVPLVLDWGHMGRFLKFECGIVAAFAVVSLLFGSFGSLAFALVNLYFLLSVGTYLASTRVAR